MSPRKALGLILYASVFAFLYGLSVGVGEPLSWPIVAVIGAPWVW